MKMTKKKHNLWKVILAIVLAMIIGSWSGTTRTLFGVNLYSVFDLFGTLFLNALSLIVIPLVTASIISGVAKMGGEKDFGRVGLKTFVYFIGTTLIAILI